MRRFIATNFAFLLILLFIFSIAIIYAYISVASHDHFQTFGWDLGFFDQIIWKASKGDLGAYSTIAKENLLADHFQVVLYFLAPLYLIKQDVRIILITQAFLVTFAATPLYLLAKKITKNGLFSFSIILSYLFFQGTQWTILNEFHQAAFIPLFLILVFYGLYFTKRWIYWSGIVGLLITKEEYGLLVGALGIFVWFRHKMKKTAIMTTIFGLIIFFFFVYYLAPHLSANGIYIHNDFGEAGYTPVDVIRKTIYNPLFFFKSMVDPPIKIKTMFDSFLSFGFLPLFAPLYLIPIIEHFISRFIYAGPQFTKWANVNHHAAALGILMSVASIYAAVVVSKILKKRILLKKNNYYTYLGLYLLFTAIFMNIYLRGPINSFFKPQLYTSLPWMEDNNMIIKNIPPDVPLAAQNSLLPHLSQREKIYLLPEISDADYIVVDLHEGPNKYSPLNYEEMRQLVDNLLLNNEFIIKDQKGEAILLYRSQVR